MEIERVRQEDSGARDSSPSAPSVVATQFTHTVEQLTSEETASELATEAISHARWSDAASTLAELSPVESTADSLDPIVVAEPIRREPLTIVVDMQRVASSDLPVLPALPQDVSDLEFSSLDSNGNTAETGLPEPVAEETAAEPATDSFGQELIGPPSDVTGLRPGKATAGQPQPMADVQAQSPQRRAGSRARRGLVFLLLLTVGTLLALFGALVWIHQESAASTRVPQTVSPIRVLRANADWYFPTISKDANHGALLISIPARRGVRVSVRTDRGVTILAAFHIPAHGGKVHLTRSFASEALFIRASAPILVQREVVRNGVAQLFVGQPGR